MLRLWLDKIPLWRGEHVLVKQVMEDFARYNYLPRLKDSAVLLNAVRDGLAVLTWEQDAFAFADSYDDLTGRYRGLRCGQQTGLGEALTNGLLVRPEAARRQIEAERVPPPVEVAPPRGGDDGPDVVIPGPGRIDKPGPTPRPDPKPAQPRRYHGTVTLDTNRTGRDAGRIADEIISHLAGLVSAKVTVTLEVEAEVPAGVHENVVRIVTENGRALKFTSQGFEQE